MVNNTIKLCLSASGLIALALFVITLHTGGRVAGLSFLELLGIACAVQVVGYFTCGVSLNYLGEHYSEYIKYGKAFKIAAGLIFLIGISACAGGGLLIFR